MSTSKQDRKAALIAAMERERYNISTSWSGVRREGNLGRHVSDNVRSHKSIWLGAAAALGWLASRVPARKKKVYIEPGTEKVVGKKRRPSLLLGLLKIVVNAAKPAVMAFITKKITDTLALTSKIQKRAIEQNQQQ